MQQSARAVIVPRCKERHRSITELMMILESAETASPIRRCTNATDRLEVPIIIDLLIFCSVDLVLLLYVNRSPSSSRSSHAEVVHQSIHQWINLHNIINNNPHGDDVRVMVLIAISAFKSQKIQPTASCLTPQQPPAPYITRSTNFYAHACHIPIDIHPPKLPFTHVNYTYWLSINLPKLHTTCYTLSRHLYCGNR